MKYIKIPTQESKQYKTIRFRFSSEEDVIGEHEYLYWWWVDKNHYKDEHNIYLQSNDPKWFDQLGWVIVNKVDFYKVTCKLKDIL